MVGFCLEDLQILDLEKGQKLSDRVTDEGGGEEEEEGFLRKLVEESASTCGCSKVGKREIDDDNSC